MGLVDDEGLIYAKCSEPGLAHIQNCFSVGIFIMIIVIDPSHCKTSHTNQMQKLFLIPHSILESLDPSNKDAVIYTCKRTVKALGKRKMV